MGSSDGVDRSNDPEPLYVSVHVPKTAGTTFRTVLRSLFGDRLQEAYEEHADSCRVESPACIHGHDVMWLFGEQIANHRNTKWLIVLRDPLGLAISLYHHAKRQPGLEFTDRGLVHWLTHEEPYRWPDPPCYPHNQYALQWMKDCRRSLDEFDFVGISEQFDESMLLMCAHFGWPWPTYEFHNVGAYSVAQLERAVADRFRVLNRADYLLYDAAVEALRRRQRTYGPRFDADLARFRRVLSKTPIPAPGENVGGAPPDR